MYALSTELVVAADGPIRIITLNRPDALNGVNRPLHQALARVWDHIAADNDARAVVLTGQGSTFSAGGDFGYMQENIDDADLRAETIDEARAIVTGMVRCPLPVIAAVNGPAVGLGCSLAVLSDLVLMADTAFLADPHLRIGLVPGDGGMVWPALTGLSRAKEFLFLGERISAHQAVELGLASRVIAADKLMPEAIGLARRLAKMPGAALQSTKRALNAYLEAQLSGAFERAFAGELESLHSAEHRDSVAAARQRQ